MMQGFLEVSWSLHDCKGLRISLEDGRKNVTKREEHPDRELSGLSGPVRTL